ncbi:MAG TPA: molybdopterin-dependent oxidoreductase [Dehalococcoidia bacterium]|nr:molybdopterin-dependent oxidoreductase [Dehalococcoidia bacterium]
MVQTRTATRRTRQAAGADAPSAPRTYRPAVPRPVEDRYREKIRWTKWTWGSHCVDCYPSNCPFRVYVGPDGEVWREEQAGTYGVVEPGVPDFNPAGCQKGVSWHRLLTGKERVLKPLKRVGERGEGKWQEISWDQALTEIADHIIDAIQEQGPESIIRIGEPAEGGTQSLIYGSAIVNALGGTVTDVQAEINDFSPGIYITFGKFDPAASCDDWFHTDLMLCWQINPAYTSIPWYHFIAEGRYRGAEVVVVAPDFNPTAPHADYFVPVRIGTDVALANAMSQTIIAEGLVHWDFVKEQTDLPLLVRLDNQKFLRASDVDGGRDDQFYWFDTKSGRIVEAPRGTLALGDCDPALEGVYQAKLKDGSTVEVTPAFALLKELLDRDYTPEKAQQICGVHPDVIRMLARKAATKRTRMLMGWNSGKYYHGDLMERSMMLVLALTGNWGKKGTGARSWAVGMFDGQFFAPNKPMPGQEVTRQAMAGRDAMYQQLLQEDPTMTEEILNHEMAYRGAHMGGTVPPAFFWYYHCGYREIWNKKTWGDVGMRRSFDEYFQEAMEKGWFSGMVQPLPTQEPRVIFEVGSNLLRRQRGGQNMLLKHLWPKLKCIVSIDWRINTTGLWSDYILPAAHHYEKPNFCYSTPHIMHLTFSDRAVPPRGESKEEFEIAVMLAQKIEERAKARNFLEYTDSHGVQHRLDNLVARLTLNGYYDSSEKVLDEMVRDSVVMGNLPEGTTLQTMREKGYVRFVNWGMSPMAIGQASDIKENETHAPFRWHTEKKMPFPTLTRRAQFYIDHDWFLEAGEQLPVHKETPAQGGDYPFHLTSGHPRWSIHSMNMTNRIILNTHRGHPFCYINTSDAEKRGIRDDEVVELYNDMGSIRVNVRVSPAVRPGQLIIYNGFEPYQFPDWLDPSNVEPGMVKWLAFAGGYGHLRYRGIHWQPVPIDRAIRLDIRKLDGAPGKEE